ncbi:MAG: hypothetical protein JWO05_1040 [Gemmatimonadetes bacterium]|nr:hypothetical protein [Gemmatimonadota bacterium]
MTRMEGKSLTAITWTFAGAGLWFAAVILTVTNLTVTSRYPVFSPVILAIPALLLLPLALVAALHARSRPVSLLAFAICTSMMFILLAERDVSSRLVLWRTCATLSIVASMVMVLLLGPML